MDLLRFDLARLEHSHGRDDWHTMVEVPHDPSQRDEEREWGRHRVFRCSTCENEIRVAASEAGHGA